MSREFATYAPDLVSVVFKGFILQGFVANTFMEAERKADGFEMHVGALGDVTRVVNLDKTGSITLTLMAQSSGNDILQTIADQDEQFRNGFGPIQIMDHSGAMECHSPIAWLRKRPKIDRAKDAGQTVWILDCVELEINASGNAATNLPF